MQWIKKLSRWGLIAALLGVLALLSVQPTAAQAEFRLLVVPSVSEVPLGNDLVLELMVENGVNLNAFDNKLLRICFNRCPSVYNIAGKSAAI